MDDRRSRILTALCLAVGATAAGLAIALALGGPAVALAPLFVLCVLAVLAENLSVELPNESGMSASFMLAMTAIVVFDSGAALLGPMLVGMSSALYHPALRARDWRKVVFNAGNVGLSSLAAAAIYNLIPSSMTESVPGQLAAAIPAGLTFSVVNFVLLTSVLSLHQGRKLADVGGELWLGDLQIYPFALLGVFLGRMYLDIGAWVVPMFVAPILISRQTFASYLNLQAAQDAALETLIRALEAKDVYTAGHVERVARFADYIGRELGLRPRRLERLRYAALMHDIGKLVVPNHLLNKPGKLTSAEYQRVQYHEEVTVSLLRRIDFLRQAAPAIGHERPDGRAANAAGLEARIIHVADAFDAMTSTRSYRRALSQQAAFAELRGNADTQFDAACVEALQRAIARREECYGSGYETCRHEFATPPPAAGVGSAGLGDLAPDELVPAPPGRVSTVHRSSQQLPAKA